MKYVVRVKDRDGWDIMGFNDCEADCAADARAWAETAFLRGSAGVSDVDRVEFAEFLQSVDDKRDAAIRNGYTVTAKLSKAR